MEFNIDELTALVLQHSRRAKQARKSAAELLSLAEEDEKLAIVYLEVGKRINRETEEKEGKMNIRRIISGVSVLVLMMLVFSLVYGSRLTLAQDTPLVTNTALVAATAEVTAAAPATATTPAEPVKDNTSLILDAIKEIALIVALVVLAFKTAGLVTADVLDKALARGFDLAKELADTTPTPVDNQLIDIAQPIISKLIDDALAKRGNVTVATTTSQTTATVPVPTIIMTDSSGNVG